MSDQPQYMTLRDYLRVVRERRLLVLIVTLIFGGAALALSVRQEPVYEASASVNFGTERTDEFGVPQSFESPEQRAARRAPTVTDLAVARRARRLLGTSIPIDELVGAITASAEARTNFVVVFAQWDDANSAARAANAFAAAAAAHVNAEVRAELRNRARIIRRSVRELPSSRANDFTRAASTERASRLETLAEIAEPATVVTGAEVPDSTISPRPIRNTALGLLVGLTLGIVAAFVRDALDRRFRTSTEIGGELELPLVANVPDELLGRGRDVVKRADFEVFRILRTHLGFLASDGEISKIAITSAVGDEGKSTVASGLAVAYALTGKKTLLVECDLRRPSLAHRLGINGAPGLSDCLAGRTMPPDVAQPVELEPPGAAASSNGTVAWTKPPSLACITAGRQTSMPAELLASERFEWFLREVAQAYDIVILDCAPLLPVGDTLGLIDHVDGLLLCVRASRTSREEVNAAKSALDNLPRRPTGLVITGTRAGELAEYDYASYAPPSLRV